MGEKLQQQPGMVIVDLGDGDEDGGDGDGDLYTMVKCMSVCLSVWDEKVTKI